jgi:hypothetical protein
MLHGKRGSMANGHVAGGWSGNALVTARPTRSGERATSVERWRGAKDLGKKGHDD